MIAHGELQLMPPPPFRSAEAANIDELKTTVSASRLNSWLRCRLHFYFKYVRRISKPPTTAAFVGKVIHAVLQQWNLARWKNEPFVLNHYRSVFEDHWLAEQNDMAIGWNGDEEEHSNSAWNCLEQYFKHTPILADERPEAVEVPVEAEFDDLPRLIGIIDLVRSGGRIVDFKTAAKTPDSRQVAHHHEVQASCYALLYRHCTGHKESDIELHHIVKTKVPKVIVTPLGPMTSLQEGRLYRLIESYLDGLDRRDFVPSPGFQCAGCEFFEECRQWTGKVI